MNNNETTNPDKKVGYSIGDILQEYIINEMSFHHFDNSFIEGHLYFNNSDIHYLTLSKTKLSEIIEAQRKALNSCLPYLQELKNLKTVSLGLTKNDHPVPMSIDELSEKITNHITELDGLIKQIKGANHGN